MAQNWWEQDQVVGAQPAPVVPQHIQGPAKQVDPMEAERLRMEQERLGLSRQGEARQAIKEQREQGSFDAGGGVEANGEQRKAAGFYQRALKSEQLFSGTNFTPRGVAGSIAARVLPAEVVNPNTSPQRQQAEAYMEDFIKAALRYESGAAIPDPELASGQRTYFPIVGDSPEAISAKAELRKNVIESLRLGAGAAATLVPDLPQTSTLTQEQVNARVGEMLMSKRSRDDIVAFLTSTGRTPTPDQIKAIDANIGNPTPDVRTASDGWRKFGVGIGDVVQGAGDIVGLVSNPLNAGLNLTGIPQAITGEPLGTDFGQSLRDTFGFPAPQGETEQLISRGVRAGAGGFGMSAAARFAAPVAVGATQNALARFGSQPLVDTASSFAGGGSSEYARQSGAGPIGQTIAGLAGAGLSIPVAARTNALMDRPAPVSNAVTAAGAAEGVKVNRAMIDPNVEGRVTGVESTMAGGPMVRREMRAVGEQIAGRVQRLGRGGTPLTGEVAGQSVKDSATRFIKDSGKKFTALYRRAEQLAGGEKMNAPAANSILDEVTARLSETAATNADELTYLAKLKSDLSKPVSVGALRDMRTTLRKKISKGELVFGQNEARVLDVMDALSNDIEGGLRAAGKGNAAAAFKSADGGYRERMEFIQGTVQKIIGKRNDTVTPGQVFERFRGMASPKGDLAGFAKMTRNMDEDESADIAATFADALGKNKAGDFSTSFLVSQAEALPQAAKVNLFGVQGAKSLDNLAVLAKEHKRVTAQFNNSKTGRTNDYRSWFANVIFGGGGGAGLALGSGGSTMVTAAATAAGVAVAKGSRDVLSARALMSPDVSKWIANAPRTSSPKAINDHFNRLGNIAARNPGLQAEIQTLQQTLMRAANENATRAVASPSEQQRQREQQR